MRRTPPIRSRPFGVERQLRARRARARAARARIGPQTAPATPGLASTHANASAAMSTPRAVGLGARAGRARRRPRRRRSARTGSGRCVIREPAGNGCAAPVLAGQPAARERPERHVGDPVLGAERQHARCSSPRSSSEYEFCTSAGAPWRAPRAIAGRVVVREAPGADQPLAARAPRTRATVSCERRRPGRARARGRGRRGRRRAARGCPRAAAGSGRARAPCRRGRPSSSGRPWSSARGPRAGCARTPAADERLAAAAAVGVGRVEPVDAARPRRRP